ncbi:MAG: hypothetical protein KDD66_15355 [Bdellovibrionales bacterium]|nr:hypothetical protein [Bdellovibrionales bacterium]
MFGVRYIKSNPTTYLIHYHGESVVREGAGLSFFYYEPVSSLVRIPLKSVDVPFVFSEVTADFQPITVQGQVTYKIAKPKQLASMLDFSVNRFGGYESDDPEMLKERLVNTAQVLTRSVIGQMNMKSALISADEIVEEVTQRLRADNSIQTLGVEILSISVLSLQPTPEMARALESEAREDLQSQSDEAIYRRRNASVEQERIIKENELNTEIAIEQKRRKIQETKMAARIAIEEERQKLIEKKVENDRKEADSKAYALEAMVKPLQGTDWRTLMAASAGNFEPELLIAMAFREMAENAGKIGELNMSPDLLTSLLKSNRKKQ